MNSAQRNQMLPGLVLIALGVLFLLSRNLNLGGSIWLIGIGAVLLLAYFTSRSYGWLIPACILLGLGVGDALGMSDLGLGLGFIAIFAVDTVVRGRASHWWPLIPGVIIAGNAFVDTNQAFFQPIQTAVSDWWPLLLVVLGVLILFRGTGRR